MLTLVFLAGIFTAALVVVVVVFRLLRVLAIISLAEVPLKDGFGLIRGILV